MTRDDGDLQRELEKIRDVVELVDQHFTHEAAMNAALHMSSTIRPAPLAIAVTAAKDDLDRLIGELNPSVTVMSTKPCTFSTRETGAACGRPESAPIHVALDQRKEAGQHVYRSDG